MCACVYIYMDFPASPVVKTSPSSAGLIPTWEAKIPQASWPKYQNIKQKQYDNKCNKDFKNGPRPKKKKRICIYIYIYIYTTQSLSCTPESNTIL